MTVEIRGRKLELPPNCLLEFKFGLFFIRSIGSQIPGFIAVPAIESYWRREAERLNKDCGGDPFDTGIADAIGDEYLIADGHAESWAALHREILEEGK